MELIRTIDLWTERDDNHTDCFMGAFIDGFDGDETPFDSFKIVKNCNCLINCNQDYINIRNKHNAIIFYKHNVPVRLLVANKNTDVLEQITLALQQKINGETLEELFKRFGIAKEEIDLSEKPIEKELNGPELDVGSCDRRPLLDCMLEGSYTESDTGFGKTDKPFMFTLVPEITIEYLLKTDREMFYINHGCSFINSDMTRIIPLQENSSLDIEETKKEFLGKNENVK